MRMEFSPLLVFGLKLSSRAAVTPLVKKPCWLILTPLTFICIQRAIIIELFTRIESVQEYCVRFYGWLRKMHHHRRRCFSSWDATVTKLLPRKIRHVDQQNAWSSLANGSVLYTFLSCSFTQFNRYYYFLCFTTYIFLRATDLVTPHIQVSVEIIKPLWSRLDIRRSI